MIRQGEKPAIAHPALPAVPSPRPGVVEALQGLRGNTLVAGKTTALRIFADAGSIANAINAETTVLRPDGSRRRLSWASGSFAVIPNSSAGPSLVVTIPGRFLPWTGPYYFWLRVTDANQLQVLAGTLDAVHFLPTKDLRVMVARVWSGFPTKPGELTAADAAMERMSWIYPVRDGVSSLDGQPDAGLRFGLYDNPMGPPHQDGHLCPLFAQSSNRPGGDSIDTAITYRFPNADEGSGGSSNHECPGQSVLYSLIVWGAPLANVFCLG